MNQFFFIRMEKLIIHFQVETKREKVFKILVLIKSKSKKKMLLRVREKKKEKGRDNEGIEGVREWGSRRV